MMMLAKPMVRVSRVMDKMMAINLFLILKCFILFITIFSILLRLYYNIKITGRQEPV
jgi:hypothetical protein